MVKKQPNLAPSSPGSIAGHGSPPQEVLPFYSDKAGKRFREFSNFYRHARPYEFRLPAFAQRPDLPESIWCDFSEKAIMAVKAALMGDVEIFSEIERATDPASCKRLGRGVRDFNEELWQEHLEEVAFEVVFQKFDSEKALRELLLSTGDKVLAEAAPNDQIWGIGLPLSDPRCRDPLQWRGRNILGHALMQARERLRLKTKSGGGAAGADRVGRGRHFTRSQQPPGEPATECAQPAIRVSPEADSTHQDAVGEPAPHEAAMLPEGRVRGTRWGKRGAKRAGTVDDSCAEILTVDG